MATAIETALALKDLFGLRFKDNPFPLENILIHVNNNLSIQDKFKTTKALVNFASASADGKAIYGADSSKRIKSIKTMLDQFWIFIENKSYEDSQFPNLVNYYEKIGKKLQSVTPQEIEIHEDHQWTYIRDKYLNQAHEQIIFNFKPAEIGDDNDPRTRKLRRDLIVNLGLVTGIEYSSVKDLEHNRDVNCNYVFVVPDEIKADDLWVGILKELVRAIHECTKSIKEIEITRNEIYDLALKKLLALCSEPYKVNGKTFFEICGVTVPNLNPINVFTTSEVYCWAPTVVLSTSSHEKDQKGFIIYQDKDVGVAEMTSDGMIIWRTTILNILSKHEECHNYKLSVDRINKRKAEILQVIKSI